MVEEQATPWRWSDKQHRFTTLPSPVFAPTDPTSPICEHDSFLPAMESFALESSCFGPNTVDKSKDLLSPRSPNSRGATWGDEQTGASSAVNRVPARCQTLESLIQSHFDDVETTLSKRQESILSPNAPEFWPSEHPPPTILGVLLRGGGAEAEAAMEVPMKEAAAATMARVPTYEELAWLDAQCDAMEEVAEVEAEAEAEESWVRHMMSQHPSLSPEEAHRLWTAGCDSSP